MLTQSRCCSELCASPHRCVHLPARRSHKTCHNSTGMSASLVRRGLELLNSDVKDVSEAKKKKRTTKQQQQQKKKQQQTPGSSTVMQLVSTRRQGVTRQVKRLQGRLGAGKSKATVKDKRIKSAVEEFRKNQRKSHMTDNLKYFMADSNKTPDSDTVKIQNHNLGRQSRSRPEPPAGKAEKATSLFTEEEFQQFQMDYFGRTVEGKK